MKGAELLSVVYPDGAQWEQVRSDFAHLLPSSFANFERALPGPTFLPMPRRRDGSRVWYGLAAPESEVAELVEVTRAAVEPGFGFVTAPDDVVDPGVIATSIAEFTAGSWVLIEVPSDVDEAVTVRALERQATNLGRRRGVVRLRPPRGVGRIKADLDLAVSTNDLSGIDRLLAELAELPHVTADNRCYVAVDALSRAGRFRDALAVEGIGRLMEATPPVAVRRAVMRAIHGLLFDGAPPLAVADLPEEVRSLLASVCERPPSLGDLADAEAELIVAAVDAALVEPPDGIEDLRTRAESEASRREQASEASPPSAAPGPAGVEPVAGRTFEERLAQAMTLGDEQALALLAQEVSSGAVEVAPPMRVFLSNYLPVDDDGRPLSRELDEVVSWQAWLDRATTGGRWDRAGTTAHEGASGPGAWPLGEDALRRFAEIPSQADEDQAANLRQGLGAFLGDELDPGTPVVRDALLAAVELVALFPPQTEQERDAVLGWVDQLSRSGLTEPDVGRLLDYLEVLIDETLTVWTLPWASDLLLAATFDPTCARHPAAHTLYSRLERQALSASHIDPEVSETLQDVADVIGTEVNEALSPQGGESDPLERLDGRNIGIYTLMESAGRGAASTVRRIAPKATVTLNHDKQSTERLRALAANADVMVVVVAAAQHAATGAVEQNRPADKSTIVKVNTKGRSGILAALRAWRFGE